MRYVVGFGRFWYDFIVGDSVALAIGGVAVLVLGWVLVTAGAGAAAEILLPLIVVATLAVSLRPGR
jgi:hypothetical protein